MNKLVLAFYRQVRTALYGHGRMLALLLLGIMLPWVVFVEVAEGIWENGGFASDQPILEWIHRHESPALDRAAVVLSTAGAPEIMNTVAGVLVLSLLLRRCRSEALFFGLAVGGAVALNNLVKVIFGRPRPALWESIAPAKFYSFPSGHAMGTAALAAALAFLLWPTPWRWPVLLASGLFALCVGFSRLYLGVHYPSDVLAGWVGSVGWVAVLHVVFSPHLQQLRTWWRAGTAYWRRGS